MVGVTLRSKFSSPTTLAATSVAKSTSGAVLTVGGYLRMNSSRALQPSACAIELAMVRIFSSIRSVVASAKVLTVPRRMAWLATTLSESPA